jgi:hypothetical protein
VKHILNIEDFKDPTTFKHEIASSTGGKSRKSLAVISDVKTLKVTFEVSDGLTRVTAYTLDNAIALYNDLP